MWVRPEVVQIFCEINKTSNGAKNKIEQKVPKKILPWKMITKLQNTRVNES